MTSKIAVTSEQIDTCLRHLSNQKNVGGRVDCLKKHDSPTLRKVMTYAYSPYIKFGVKIAKSDAFELIQSSSDTSGLDIDEQDIWALLDQFQSSTASSMSKMLDLKGLFKRLNRQTAYLVLGILEKSMVKGISHSTINKAWPDTIPVFSVQLAQKYADKKLTSFPAYVEIKYDGVRAAGIIYASGDVECLTRTGRPIPAAVFFHDELRAIGKAYAKVVDEPAHRLYKGCVTDGELCGDTFNESVSLFRSDAPATQGKYHVFDILPMDALTDDKFQSDAFEVRRETLRQVMEAAQAEMARVKGAPLTRVIRSASYVVNSKEEIWKMYLGARAQNLEGLIVKEAKGLWQRKRSNDWLKIKAEETGDFKVIGAFEGEGEKEGTLGGLIVAGECDGKKVNSRVGSGFTDAEGDEIWAMFLRDLERSEQGITDPDEFELIGCIAEVQFQEITPDGSLRHPVFKKLRKDKDEVNF